MKLVSFAVAHKFQLKVSTCNGGFMPHSHQGLKLPCTFREKIFGFSFFLDKNKLPSKFLRTKKEFSNKSEYLPRNWDVSDFHRKLNFTLIDSILLPV